MDNHPDAKTATEEAARIERVRRVPEHYAATEKVPLEPMTRPQGPISPETLRAWYRERGLGSGAVEHEPESCQGDTHGGLGGRLAGA